MTGPLLGLSTDSPVTSSLRTLPLSLSRLLFIYVHPKLYRESREQLEVEISILFLSLFTWWGCLQLMCLCSFCVLQADTKATKAFKLKILNCPLLSAFSPFYPLLSVYREWRGFSRDEKLHLSLRLFLILFFVPLTNHLASGSNSSCRRSKAVLRRRR